MVRVIKMKVGMIRMIRVDQDDKDDTDDTNYDNDVINDDDDNIKKPEITIDATVNKLISKLKKPTDKGIKSLDEKIELCDILEVYVPVYEARLIGPKKKIKILRIDAVRKKIL